MLHLNCASSIALAVALILAASPCRAVTVSAPYLVKNINPEDSEGYQLTRMTAVGDVLFFFTAGRWPDPPVLWKTDGSAAGTVPVADAGVDGRTLPYVDIGRVRNPIAFRNMLVFGTVPPSGLWTSDGTAEGTHLIAPLEFWDTGIDPSSITSYGDTLFIVGRGPGNTYGLWRSDGTPEGTTLVKEAGGSQIASFQGGLVLVGRSGVWTSDGTAEGTGQIVPTGPEAPFLRPGELRIAGDLALFTSCGRHRGPCQLWRTDGTDEGTFAIATLIESYDDDDQDDEFDPTVLPSAAGDGSFLVCTTYGVWSSDGTAEGTRRVALPTCDWDTVKQKVGGVWIFNRGSWLWRSDGTPEGTESLGPFGGGRVEAVLGGTNEVVVFAVKTEEGGTELWRSDGTAAGTFAVSPMPTVGVFENSDDEERPVVGTLDDTVFFSGCNQTPYQGCDLWAVTISSPSTTTTTSSSTSTSTSTSTTSTTLTCPFGTAALCDDDDPCTVDACESGRCHHQLRPGLAGVRCRLRHYAPPSLACQDSMPKRLQRRLKRARTFVRRAGDAGDQKNARRRIRRATRQLEAARNLLVRGRPHRMGFACEDALERAIVQASAGMTHWLATDRGG